MITKVDRYGTYTGDYVYYVHHDTGDIDQYANGNLPGAVKRWIARNPMTWMKSKSGEYFYRFG